MKTHKSLAKRIKITKTGKVMKVKAGQNHFNARESGKITRQKRRHGELSHVYDNAIKKLLPFN